MLPNQKGGDRYASQWGVVEVLLEDAAIVCRMGGDAAELRAQQVKLLAGVAATYGMGSRGMLSRMEFPGEPIQPAWLDNKKPQAK